MQLSNIKSFVILLLLIGIPPCILKADNNFDPDKYNKKIKSINSLGKLDSLIKSNEAFVLPLDTLNTDIEYAEKAAELVNAYVMQRRGKEGLSILRYLKNLKDDIKHYLPKYNGHFVENSINLFSKDKLDLIKSNNLEMLRLAKINRDQIGQLSAIENLAYRAKAVNSDSFLHYVNLFGELCIEEHHFKIYHTYKGEYFGQVNPDSAKYHYTKALTHAINTSDSTKISSSYTHLSDFLSSVGEFELAIEYALTALDYLSVNSGARGFRYINTYISITEIYKDMEDFVMAEDYVKKAIVLAEKNKYKIRNKTLARIYGEILVSQGRFEEALTELLKAKQGHEQSGNNKAKIQTLTALGICYFELGDYNNTSSIIKEINQHKDILNANPKIKYRTLLIAGNLSMKQKNYTHAANAFLEAYKIASNLDLKAQSISISKSLGDAYSSDKKWAKANIYYKKALDLRESQFNEDIINSTKKLDAIYKKTEQEKKIFKLNAQNEANAAVLEQKNKTLTIGGIALLIISLLSFVAFALYRSVKSKNGIIASALAEKDILLREIHHRVKNNLQIISSLLSLQSRQIDDVDIKQAINEGRNRVRSMALIHQNLYQKESLTGVSVPEYLNKLTSELFDTYNINNDRITLNLNIENIDLDVETMVPLGLIINELVSNSLKHAFPGNKTGIIDVSLQEINKSLMLAIHDNGIGTTQEQMEASNSFGNRLIKAFSNKLKANFSVEEQNGTLVKLEVKSYKKAG